MTTPKASEGFAEFNAPTAGKPCRTWYKVYGDLASEPGPGTRRPLIVAHGGPGMLHNYLLAYADLASKFSIPVILYDQLGNGNSSHLPEKMGDGSFWNDKLFTDELENLIKHLGIKGGFDLLGHSWGGMLVAKYASMQPKGLGRLVLHSSPASITLWDEAQSDLRNQLPQDVQDALTKHEANGTTDSPEYQAAIQDFHRRHLCKLEPLPEDLTEMFRLAGKDPTVTATMYGDDEFHTVGTLKGWSIVDEICKIQVPTLLINGRDDTAQDKVMKPFFRSIAKVRWVQMANSSHVAHLEERERVMKVVGEFLTDT